MKEREGEKGKMRGRKEEACLDNSRNQLKVVVDEMTKYTCGSHLQNQAHSLTRDPFH